MSRTFASQSIPMRYPPGETMLLARRRYFDRYALMDGGYDRPWVKLKAGPLAVCFPNVAARVRAARLHDLHHVLTEYEATWIGEAEIGAWELASGCRHHWPSWVLDTYAFAIGWLIAPRRTFRAFIRGRHSRNLYRHSSPDPFLDRTVGELRAELRLDAPPPRPRASDVGVFLVWSAIAAVVGLLPIATAIAAVFFVVHAL